jgi:RND superfamily putative drug exporter
LYALGRWAAHRRGRVLAAWLLLLAVVGGLGITLHGKLSREFSVPGIESQQATDLLKKQFATEIIPAARAATASH